MFMKHLESSLKRCSGFILRVDFGRLPPSVIFQVIFLVTAIVTGLKNKIKKQQQQQKTQGKKYYKVVHLIS